MREILFRGKDYTGNWVFGNLIIDEDGDYYIIENEFVEKDGHHLYFNTDKPLWVENESVGQYIGMVDKNGKKIFEGDVVKSALDGINREVIFADTYWYGWYADSTRYGMESLQEFEQVDGNRKPFVYFYGEVIGNIHDNPELLSND